MVIFHSYVSLPEGKTTKTSSGSLNRSHTRWGCKMRHLFLTSGPKAVGVGRTKRPCAEAPADRTDLGAFFWKHIFFSDHLNHVFFLKINNFNFLDPPKHRPKPAHKCHIRTCWPYKTVSEHQDHKDCYRSSAPGGQATWKIITLRKWVIRLSFF